jgi:hypothetical protein
MLCCGFKLYSVLMVGLSGALAWLVHSLGWCTRLVGALAYHIPVRYIII